MVSISYVNKNDSTINKTIAMKHSSRDQSQYTIITVRRFSAKHFPAASPFYISGDCWLLHHQAVDKAPIQSTAGQLEGSSPAKQL